MSAVTVAGLLLIVLPFAFNAAFATLAARFDYPDVLRQPTAEVLAKFHAGGSSVVLTWWAFALTTVLLAPLAVLVSSALDDAVGEHLGYGLTGAWTTLTGVALAQTAAAPGWVGVAGIVIGPVLRLCALEFVGGHEPAGWKPAERLTPIAYVAWSLWLVVTGVALLA